METLLEVRFNFIKQLSAPHNRKFLAVVRGLSDVKIEGEVSSENALEIKRNLRQRMEDQNIFRVA